MPGKSRIFSSDDARRLAKRRLPKLVFDFVDGATGREVGARRNCKRLDDIRLQSRVMADTIGRRPRTTFLGSKYNLPFGIAPMGMCNLVHPKADDSIARMGASGQIPVCVSSAASTSLEQMYELSNGNAWFQLYFGASREASLASVQRAKEAGFDTLILTADVPVVSRRVRDLRNGFNVPFRLSARSFFDFATHPAWSVSMLAAGAPSPQNFSAAGHEGKFDRNASRAGADWDFLRTLRDAWPGRLIVKGVTSPEDALNVRNIGVDAIYVSNHGARQLDSSAAAIDLIGPIRSALGSDIPLIFDSGLRGGEDVLKAIALGADFAMLGRPILFALGADGERGLRAYVDSVAHDLDVAMAQVGVSSIEEIGAGVLFNTMENTIETAQSQQSRIRVAAGK